MHMIKQQYICSMNAILPNIYGYNETGTSIVI